MNRGKKSLSLPLFNPCDPAFTSRHLQMQTMPVEHRARDVGGKHEVGPNQTVHTPKQQAGGENAEGFERQVFG